MGWYLTSLILVLLVLLLLVLPWQQYRKTALRLLQGLLLLALTTAVAVCVVFHVWPNAAPPDLAVQLQPVLDRLVGDLPLLGLLYRRTSVWAVLAVVGILTTLPHLAQLEMVRRQLGRSAGRPGRTSRSHSGKSQASASRNGHPETPRLIGDLLAADRPLEVRPLAPQPRLFSWLKRTPAKEAAMPPPVVSVGLLVRSHGGKSELIDQACLRSTRLPFPSGLQLGFQDPCRLNEILHERRRTEKSLPTRGRETTTHARSYPLALFEAGEERLILRLHDAVGQLLTSTTRTSEAPVKAQHEAFLNHLAGVDVIWQIVPCPPQPWTLDVGQRFMDDVQRSIAYVRAALRRRPAARRCAVALVVNRVDTLYPTEAECRQRFETQLVPRLHLLLRPLIEHPRVSHLALFPVSAWGFGTSVVQRKPADARQKTGPAKAGKQDVLLYGEPEWLLKPGVSPQPFNLRPLLVWSLLAGIGGCSIERAGAAVPDLVRVGRLLRDDLEAPGSCLFVWKDAQEGDKGQ